MTDSDAPIPPEIIAAMAKEAKILEPDRQAAFAQGLNKLAAYYRDVLTNMPSEFDKFSPFDATLTERVDWLDTEVLNPLKCQSALNIDPLIGA
ncbi:MAG: hypothetical protein KGJ57_18935 [Sphingomonadales bacterium]|nr:hypothetical protein [Sphingomonadales bacterium]MDE2171472.1 hypothetical protein [Sphingomonadales bacterium]